MVVHGELRVLVPKRIRTEGVPCLRQRIWVLGVCIRFDAYIDKSSEEVSRKRYS